jgi:TatD DNase family protein
MKLIDSHCHLELKDFPISTDVIARAKAAGVIHAVVVGLLQKTGDFGNALAAAQANSDYLTPTYGIHPHDAAIASQSDLDELARLVSLPQVKAVGETGLDFYYNHSPADIQEKIFRIQCQLAKSQNKPIVIHVRDAHEQCAQILESEKMTSGMIHCFTGDTDAARKYLNLGFHLSISGVVTYKKTEALQAAVAFAPVERLMLETDSPYLSPDPFRGKWPNEPMRVEHTARKVAQLKSMDADELAFTCAKNTVNLLSIDAEVLK